MDDDVSVTRLSDDAWNDRVPPGPGSRLRVVAVMGAAVVGCLVAAVVVAFAGRDDASPDPDPDEPVIAIPDRTTSGVAGPDATVTREIGHSTGATTAESSERTSTSTTTTTTSTTPQATTSEQTSGEVTATTAAPPPARPGTSTPPSSPPNSPPSSPPPAPPTTPPPEDDCAWWIICW